MPAMQMTTFKRFSELDCPPDVPVDSFFELAATTVVSDAEPYRIGNDLLNFFDTIPGKVIKVNTKKFTIKAEVDLHPAPCLLKVRVYRLGEQFTVEFQRPPRLFAMAFSAFVAAFLSCWK